MPVKLSTHAIERGTYVITLSFTDENGDAVTPNTATWTLTDRAGVVVNGREDVTISSLAATKDVVLSGADLAVTDNRYRHRLFTVEYTYTSSLGTLPGKEEVGFYIDPLRAVS